MGPIRRSRKRKPEPEPPAHLAAPEPEARGGKPVRFLLRSSERLRTPPQPRPEPAPSSQVRGRRRQRVPRRVYRFLADLSSSDAKPVDRGPRLTTGKKNSAILALAARNGINKIAATTSGNQSNEIGDKSDSYLHAGATDEDVLFGPVCPDLSGCNENDQIQRKPRYFPEKKVKQPNTLLLGQSSVSLSQPSEAGFGHFEYDPKFSPSSQLEVSSSWVLAMPAMPRTGCFRASLFGTFGQLRPPPQVPVLDIQSLIPGFDTAEGSKAFADEMVCYKRGKKVVEKSVREASKSVATSEELTNTENDIGKEVSNDATDSGILPEINTTICIESAPVKDNKGSQKSDIHEIIPNQMPVGMHGIYQEHYIGALHGAAEYGSTSHNFGAADVFLSNSSTQYGNNATKADKCATSMEQDIGEESFEQYLVMDDGSNDNLMPSIKSSEAISHEHHPSKDNVATIMECETSCAVATENMSVMPLALINDVVPNLLPSNVTSDVGKTAHRGDTELPGNMAAIQHATSDSPFSDIFVPAFRDITTNTQSSTKKFAAEQEEMSPEHHTSPMKEYAGLSSQSIGKSAMDQFFSTDVTNATEAEHGIGLTMPQYAKGTMSECVASGTDFSYCPLLHKSLVVPESTVADRPPSEPLATENPPFLRTSHMWAHIEGMEIFKKVPQRPHFHPFKELGPELSEAMALGLMVFFANTAESIKNLNIQDEAELFKEKLKGLCLLEEHGFDVRHLRSRLETLLHMKNSNSELQNSIKKLEEKITLKEIDGQQRGTQISMLYTATRQLERQAKLFRCILKSSVSQQKTDALEISRLKTEACDLEKSCLSVEQQFSSVVAAPW